MNENIVTSLFSRVILDMIIGFFVIGLIQMASVTVRGDAIAFVATSSVSAYSAVIFAVAGYVLGTIIDRVGYFVCDRWLFQGEFSDRRSNFELPRWCISMLETRIAQAEIVPAGYTRVAEPGSDWISGLFQVLAPIDAQARRRDLVSNYQFMSNVLVVAILATIVTPVFLYVQRSGWLAIAVTAAALILLVVAVRMFCIVAVRRLHTFENVIVFAKLVAITARLDDSGRPLADEGTVSMSRAHRVLSHRRRLR